MIKEYAISIRNILSKAVEPDIKALECMFLLLSRLNDSQLSENSMGESDEDEELNDLDDIEEIQGIDDKNLKFIQKIYNELFDDQSYIVNFLQMLNNDDSANSKHHIIILKILTLSCCISTKICATVLKNDFMSIVTKWLPKKIKDMYLSTDEIDDKHDSSDYSDNEEFKLGSGGAATTSYHMARKNSNAKIVDLTNPEETDSQREIFNLLYILLSIDLKNEGEQSQDVIECKNVLMDKTVQMHLGRLCAIYCIKFSVNSLNSELFSVINNSRKYKIIEMMEKVVSLIDPEILSTSFNANTISRQLRLFIISANPRASDFSYKSNYCIDIECKEEGCILSVLEIIKKLLKKNFSYFSIPMIREGILSITNEMLSQCKEDKILPSIDYISYKIKSEVLGASNDVLMSPCGSPFENKKKLGFPNKLLSKKQQIKNCLTEIKKQLENAKYSLENYTELKRISQTLCNEHSSIHSCKESLIKLKLILNQDGITYFEASESKIINSLHKFCIECSDESIDSKPVLNRIALFANELIENEKCTSDLISIINSDAFIEELHLSNRDCDSFLLKSRFNETDQIRIVCELKPEVKKPTNEAIGSFMNSMIKYENEYDEDFLNDFDPFVQSNYFKSNPVPEKEITFLEKVKKFTIVAPSNYSFKQLERFINDKIKNIDDLEKLHKNKNLDIYIETHCYCENSYNIEFGGKKNQVKCSPVKLSNPKLSFVCDLQDEEFDNSMTLENWVKRRCKDQRCLKPYLRIFNKQTSIIPNLVNFVMQNPSIKEEDKNDMNEEMIGEDKYSSTKLKKNNFKSNRTYSLYLQREQKQQKTLQERELERIVTKDIQSNSLIREEIGDDACKVLELMKLIFLLKNNNMKNFFTQNLSQISSEIRFNVSTTQTNFKKFKSMFVSSKMDSLLKKYLLLKHCIDSMSKKDEAIIEIVQHFPMMYDFQTRILFFKLTAFSSLRNRYYASELSMRTRIREESGVTISRRKKQVSRDTILNDALNKIKDLQNDDSFLEFQFENEVGTGLGPTLEYYALISKVIKEEPDMWKETSDNTLYPNPLNFKKRSIKDRKRIEKFFELVGTIIARSLMDERLIDLPISVVFWKLVFSETAMLDDLKKIDKSLYKGLQLIQEMIEKNEATSSDPLLPKHSHDTIRNENKDDIFKFPGSLVNTDWKCEYEEPKQNEFNIEDMCLTFTLPGTENIDLIRGGHKKEVNNDNAKEYIRMTLNTIFNDAVKVQVNAFRRGLSNVFRLNSLKCFMFEELEELISGEDSFSNNGLQKWNRKTLLENVIPDHGYTQDSNAFLFFIEYMENMNREEIRKFLMFITGSPRLPLGGLKSLRPKLTVVKRTCDEGDNPDNFLPSVMTCQNYVKLPDFSSIEVLKAKMNYAINEGVNSFNLS